MARSCSSPDVSSLCQRAGCSDNQGASAPSLLDVQSRAARSRVCRPLSCATRRERLRGPGRRRALCKPTRATRAPGPDAHGSLRDIAIKRERTPAPALTIGQVALASSSETENLLNAKALPSLVISWLYYGVSVLVSSALAGLTVVTSTSPLPNASISSFVPVAPFVVKSCTPPTKLASSSNCCI